MSFKITSTDHRLSIQMATEKIRTYYTVRSESSCELRVRYIDLVVSIEVAIKCAAVSLYSIVKQRLNCSTGKVCNCLIQFLLYRRSWTSLPTPFISAQRLSERTVLLAFSIA
jgi:hypothetical protein